MNGFKESLRTKPLLETLTKTIYWKASRKDRSKSRAARPFQLNWYFKEIPSITKEKSNAWSKTWGF